MPADMPGPPTPWDHLPSGLLLHIAGIVGGGAGPVAGKTLLRLVCQGWRVSVPLDSCKIWGWEQGMDSAITRHAFKIKVLAPLPGPDSSPLPQLPACARLHHLMLCHIRSAALPALSGLTRLQRLDATVLFRSASPDWLDWASGLACLRELRLTAAAMQLQPEEGLQALLPLRRRLTTLRLSGCLLLTERGAALLAQLSWLERLEVTSCQLNQASLDDLAQALPRLAHVELRLLDGTSADGLLRHTRVAAGGSLSAHVTRAKANGLVGTAGRQMPGLGCLSVILLGCGFVLSHPPTFHLMTNLITLKLPGIQLPPDAVRQLAACTRLQELQVELTFTVRDEALLSWRALCALRRLSLAGNFYLTEGALAAVLAAMPHMQDLRLQHIQGSGALLAPVAHMSHLSSLELSSCHLNDSRALTAALCSAAGLARLRVQSCGIQSEVCEAVVAALCTLPALGGLHLGLHRTLPRSTVESLALACARCTQLTSLDVHFPSHVPAVPAVPAWRQLSVLTGLRRLHASTGVGWDADSFSAVAAAAKQLRSVTVTDNAGQVGHQWAVALGTLGQLSALELNGCNQLGVDETLLLCQLSALTSLSCCRCPGLEADGVMQQLRAGLPSLAYLIMHD